MRFAISREQMRVAVFMRLTCHYSLTWKETYYLPPYTPLPAFLPGLVRTRTLPAHINPASREPAHLLPMFAFVAAYTCPSSLPHMYI
jgi:hypothetical protein